MCKLLNCCLLCLSYSDPEDDISEDLDAALRSLQTLTNKVSVVHNSGTCRDSVCSRSCRSSRIPQQP